jgi:hypothetical protein
MHTDEAAVTGLHLHDAASYVVIAPEIEMCLETEMSLDRA